MVNPFIKTVTLKNYKSIAACKVSLQSLTFIVGPNGAGKSNFLDALQFISDALKSSLDHALRERGSLKEVRRRSGGHPTHFAIRVDFEIPGGDSGHYSFRVGAKPNGEFVVQEEECEVIHQREIMPSYFRIENGTVRLSSVSSPVVISDRLALVNFAGTEPFRPAFDALSQIEIYNINPKEIAKPEKIDRGEQLRRDGSNAPSILRYVADEDRRRINEYLAKIVPGIKDVEPLTLGSYETLEFRQSVKGQKEAWRFPASSMSDGTLRALGILIATLQRASSGPLLLGLEEPETAVHPAAARVIMDALRYASERRQVLVTSHSPDLLDDPDIAPESLLTAVTEDGITTIGETDEASREAVRSHLFTPGELLRQNQFAPSAEAASLSGKESQLMLFDVTGSQNP